MSRVASDPQRSRVRLHPALEAWAKDSRVKAVVIRGAGGRAFCAGGDVRAVALSLGSPAPLYLALLPPSETTSLTHMHTDTVHIPCLDSLT